jgi:predicted metal-dependent hydrolase
MLSPNDPHLVEGLRLVNEGRYWEAHEVLEDLWMAKVGDEKLFLQALIQVTVGFYHRENGNEPGVTKLFAHAREKLGKLRGRQHGGLTADALEALIDRAATDHAVRPAFAVDPALPRPAYRIDENGEVHFA